MYYVLTPIDKWLYYFHWVLYILVFIMWVVIRSVLHIVAYSLSLYLLSYYSLLWWVNFDFAVSTVQDMLKVYLSVWFVFWLCFSLIKKVLKIVAFPFNMLTFGLVWFIINIAIFYLCQLFINTYLIGVEMQITSFTGLLFVSFVLSVVVSFVYWILKKII